MLVKRNLPAIGAQTLLLLLIAGCQTHEFKQAGVSTEQRDADSLKCLREGRAAYEAQQKPGSAPTSSTEIVVGSAVSGYNKGRAMGEYHKECMAKLGYKSVKLD
jgi:hypothetical protein